MNYAFDWDPPTLTSDPTPPLFDESKLAPPPEPEVTGNTCNCYTCDADLSRFPAESIYVHRTKSSFMSLCSNCWYQFIRPSPHSR